MVVNVMEVVARSLICLILGFWESQVHKNGRFPALDADEPPSKFDTVSFILGGEIHNHTNKQKHTHKKGLNDISTPCLSACVDSQLYT